MRITVAVPTIDGRSKYLASCLKTCVTQDEDFEILVSDNPGGLARDVAASFNDPRVRYITPPKYLPMSAHFDFVLSQVKGDLLTYIGDDDGLMPGCIGRIAEISREAANLPIQHALANYFWPDYADASFKNAVLFHHAVGKEQRTAESMEFLRRLARGKARYLEGPMVYHNFVPMDIIRRLTRDGRFFRRSAPDMYSAIAIAMNEPRFFSTDELLTLSGQGAKSNGAAVQLGQGDVFLAETHALYKPRFSGRSVQMAVLDSLIEAAEHFDRPDVASQIDFAGHFAQLVREARHSMSGRLKHDEFRRAFTEARRRGVVYRTIAELVGTKLGRHRGNVINPPSNAVRTFEAGEVIQMPENVDDIASACGFLATRMAA